MKHEKEVKACVTTCVGIVNQILDHSFKTGMIKFWPEPLREIAEKFRAEADKHLLAQIVDLLREES